MAASKKGDAQVDKGRESSALEPHSLDAQWDEVQGWHDYLRDHYADDRPMIDSLSIQWEAIRDSTGMSDEEYGRGLHLRRTADTPLSALFYFIEMGFYPPPELLLGIADTWQRYMRGGGALTLEDAFFGPPRKGIGNHAARKHSRYRHMWMQWKFHRMIHNGMSRNEAAEEVSRGLGGKPDADSILRMMRGFPGPAIETPEMPEK